MVAKLIKGTSFRGVVSYLLGKEEDKAKIIACEGMRQASLEEIVQDFALQSSLSTRIKKSVGYIIIGFSPKDKLSLSDEKMREIAEDYLLRMGCKDTQYLMVRHLDREHPHLLQ